MILPISSQFAREAASFDVAALTSVAREAGFADSDRVAVGQTRASACDSIFRYPSPCGCSESVPSGTPALLHSRSTSSSRRQNVAQFGAKVGNRFHQLPKKASYAAEAKYKKGSLPWKTLNSRSCVAQWLSDCQPVATPLRNRQSSVPVPVRRPQRLLAAAGWLAQPLAVRPTLFTAKKTPASANALNFRGVVSRPTRHHKAIVSRPGAGGLFVSKRPRTASGQDQEGT